MSIPSSAYGFMRGMLTGMVCGCIVIVVLVYVLNMSGIMSISIARVPDVHRILAWAYDNLRLSVIPFGLTLVFYWRALAKLQGLLAQQERVQTERIAQAEHVLDILIGVFFGIGVIWTAIGMRSALLQALGGLSAASAAEQGAFTILQRLVDGGIILALSTTIFGAVGGYVLRLIKALTVGSRLQSYYAGLAAEEREEVTGRLQAIENHLSSLVSQGDGAATWPETGRE